MEHSQQEVVLTPEVAFVVDDNQPAALEQQIQDARPIGRATVVPPNEAPSSVPAVTAMIFASSDKVDQIYGALAAAQASDGYGEAIERTLTAQVTNSGATFDYAPLSEVLKNVRPRLAAQGISILQLPLVKRGGNSTAIQVRTILGHKSGQWVSNDLVVSIGSASPRDVGTGITYARRYGLTAITGVAPDFDNDADETETVQPPKPATRQSQKTADLQPTGANIGKIADVKDTTGAVLVTLSTGFRCGTNVPELIVAVRSFAKSGKTVELMTKPSSNPAKYVPVLEEIAAYVGD